MGIHLAAKGIWTKGKPGGRSVTVNGGVFDVK